jgi:hypothetical protein
MLRRSGVIALVVGTLLTAINQGDVLLAGRWPPALFWKLPLTSTLNAVADGLSRWRPTRLRAGRFTRIEQAGIS